MAEIRHDSGLGLARPAAGAQPLSELESLRLLASVSYGRVVFSVNALPAIRPVNHIIDDGLIIIRTRLRSALPVAMRAADHLVAAYEADDLDPVSRSGWSVVVTGRAVTVTDSGDIARYEQLLHPWVNHADTVVSITPDIVSGFRIVGDSAHSVSGTAGEAAAT